MDSSNAGVYAPCSYIFGGSFSVLDRVVPPMSDYQSRQKLTRVYAIVNRKNGRLEDVSGGEFISVYTKREHARSWMTGLDAEVRRELKVAVFVLRESR